MITLIEIDGFKTFKDFKVELAPFQVIVGPNGSGKSNLFDALKLLSRIADNDLHTAFQELRGEANELFTTLPGGRSVDRIRIAVEMLVNRKLRDRGEGEIELIRDEVARALRKEVALKFTRLRYELEITPRIDGYGLEQLYVTHESLKSILPDSDNWCRKYGLSSDNNWLPSPSRNQAIFIDTKLTTIAILESVADKSEAEAKQPLIYLYPDSSLYPDNDLYPSSDKQERIRRFYTAEVQRTVLSRVDDTDHPHILAAREEFRLLRLLHLNPEALRLPSSMKASRFISTNGSNLPTMLARMQAEDKFALTDVSRDMANLVPGILKIRVEQDKPSDKYVIYAETSDHRSFSSQVFSDGTLRLLALATLRNDPQFHGVLCLEEPENGVHPQRLKKLAQLLRRMATNFNDPEEVDEPLRQVLITTHSPVFISLPEVIDSLLFAYTMTSVEPLSSNIPTLEITCMTPVVTPGAQTQFSIEIYRDETMEAYTLDEVLRYLDSEDLDEARKQLEKVRTKLNEV
jgi:predicted ATPase